MLKHGFIILAGAAILAGPAAGADVEYFGVIKSGMYTQAVGSASSPITHTNAYAFTSFVLGTTNGAVTNATVKIPSGAIKQLSTNATDSLLGALLSSVEGAWIYTTNFATQGALDSAFPSTSGFLPSLSSRYTANMSTVNDGLQSQELSYYLISTPPTPTISNLTNAQDIVTTNDFTLTWNSMSGGLIPKIVMLTILDQAGRTVYSSPLPFTTGALDGNSTSVVPQRL